MNIKTNLKSLLAGVAALAGFAAVAEPTVMVNKVESKEPWTEVQVDYTLGGLDVELEYKVAIEVMLRGETRGVTNAAAQLENKAYTQMIDTKALFGVEKADPCAKARVLLFVAKPKHESVQLWKDGPCWATCNLGARKPEEAGYYFWWGDTVGCVHNDADNEWVSVKDGTVIRFRSSDLPAGSTFHKTVEELRSEGWIDESGILTIEHDAARAYLGENWRLPTDAEMSNLVENCTAEWTTRNGVVGYVVTGKGEYANKSIFLPAAGEGFINILRDVSEDGYYRSSLPASNPGSAYSLHFTSENFGREYDIRSSGYSIRPVR